jgi:hypothetical protein
MCYIAGVFLNKGILTGSSLIDASQWMCPESDSGEPLCVCVCVYVCVHVCVCVCVCVCVYRQYSMACYVSTCNVCVYRQYGTAYVSMQCVCVYRQYSMVCVSMYCICVQSVQYGVSMQYMFTDNTVQYVSACGVGVWTVQYGKCQHPVCVQTVQNAMCQHAVCVQTLQ